MPNITPGPGAGEPGPAVSEEKRREFVSLFAECARTFLSSNAGQQHFSAYDVVREEGRQSFAFIAGREARGEDVTDDVLLKLLPHNNTRPHREAGAWIHIAPAVTKDVKSWFAGRGWETDWPEVGTAIMRFLRRVNDDLGQLEAACEEFSASPNSRGFQAGMLSPIMNALRPDDYLVINKKSQKVINHFAGTWLDTTLRDYPTLNRVGLGLTGELFRGVDRSPFPGVREEDLFDAFSHWLVGVKKYFDGGGQPPPPADRPFTPKTFELLSGLHEEPTRDHYNAHREELEEYLIKPFQDVFRRVAARLPAPIRDAMETEKRVFSRILKNDYGQGGAWDYYWGAFYPKGGKRTEAAQLFMRINRERLAAGFYIGVYGGDQRERFLRNLNEHRQALNIIFQDFFNDPSLSWDGGERPAVEDTGPEVRTASTWAEWVAQAQDGAVRAAVTIPKEEVLALSTDQLVVRIVGLFEQLYPLVLMAVSERPMAAIGEYLGEGDEGDEEEKNPEYTLAQLAEETGFAVETLEQWVLAVERKKQAVLFGPPGTGKTFVAERLARHLAGGGDGVVELIQFHPATEYEDFMIGIRPRRTAEGGLDYPPVPGRFLEFCEAARKREGLSVLVIDEINRADLARVFGELMFLLEYRDREVRLPTGQVFSVPPQVRLVGTMNTADRSIALVDHALRRRFAFLQLYPDFEVLNRYQAQHGVDVAGLVQTLRQLNERIGDRHYEVGQSFFMVPDLPAQLENIWRTEIEPYVEEYFFDRRSQADEFRWEAVRDRVRPPA